jgi:putative glutamine amidotransferase
MSKRIGLTMRVTDATGYSEPRDSLAQDWAAFMSVALPEAIWLPIPNIGEQAGGFLDAWDVDGIILTGGNDVGEIPLRDQTEAAALDYALQHGLPVFGVCRGLQMIQTYFGGHLQSTEKARHVAVRHKVRFVDSPHSFNSAGAVRDVNSFHNQCVALSCVAAPLRTFAATDDGLAEGIFHPDAPLVAVQWHPEREAALSEVDRELVRRTFEF